MFSMAELSFASWRESVLMRIVSFGICHETHLSSARAARESVSCFSIAMVSICLSRGSFGGIYGIIFLESVLSILSFSLRIAMSRYAPHWWWEHEKLESPHPLHYRTPSACRPTMCIIAIGRIVLTPDDGIARRAISPLQTRESSYLDGFYPCSTLVHEFHFTLSCSGCRRG